MRCLLLLAVSFALLASAPAQALAPGTTAAGLVHHELTITPGYPSCSSTAAVVVAVDLVTGSAEVRLADPGDADRLKALACFWQGDQFLVGKCTRIGWDVSCFQAFAFPGDGTSSRSELWLGAGGDFSFRYTYTNPNAGAPSFTHTLEGVLARV